MGINGIQPHRGRSNVPRSRQCGAWTPSRQRTDSVEITRVQLTEEYSAAHEHAWLSGHVDGDW
eukprot:CAMPEP_0171561684 /NCGR_PEP_ID=MMETSP0960-20121227/14504_1 /TAXON_ID=87120 /ORGANISM="Aurantiochytrium limacinum, Strain ATCCMYA-1381" /LENGTH=62 /DNA_ID=CAMNT_0012114253 /DNA_START=71 /DNA_END=256 /DNA_ORIENTATION=+